MGARVNFVFKTEASKPALVLYSHWGEESWRQDLAAAITKATRRIDIGDTSYATRIIIDQLTKEGRDEETGFGLYVADEEQMYWDTTVEIDMVGQMVNDEGNWHSFTSFCNYQEEIVEYHNV
jgi:hypothetical protein